MKDVLVEASMKPGLQFALRQAGIRSASWRREEVRSTSANGKEYEERNERQLMLRAGGRVSRQQLLLRLEFPKSQTWARNMQCQMGSNFHQSSADSDMLGAMNVSLEDEKRSSCGSASGVNVMCCGCAIPKVGRREAHV